MSIGPYWYIDIDAILNVKLPKIAQMNSLEFRTVSQMCPNAIFNIYFFSFTILSSSLGLAIGLCFLGLWSFIPNIKRKSINMIIPPIIRKMYLTFMYYTNYRHTVVARRTETMIITFYYTHPHLKLEYPYISICYSQWLVRNVIDN